MNNRLNSLMLGSTILEGAAFAAHAEAKAGKPDKVDNEAKALKRVSGLVDEAIKSSLS